MNKIGCALLIVAVPLVGIAALVALSGWLLSDTADQSHLTRAVVIEVVNAKEATEQGPDDWALDYRYRADGQWYLGEGRVDVRAWKPGDPLTVCIDPDKPAEHVLKIHADDRCGEEFLAPSVETATPTTTRRD